MENSMREQLLKNPINFGYCPKCGVGMLSDSITIRCPSCEFSRKFKQFSCERNYQTILFFFRYKGIHKGQFLAPESLGDGRFLLKQSCILCYEELPASIYTREKLLSYGYSKEMLDGVPEFK